MAIDGNNDVTNNKDLQHSSSSPSSCPAFSSSSSSHPAFSSLLEAATKSFIKQIDELKKKLNETKDYKIFDQIQDLLDAFTDACMLLKMANDDAENAVDEANKNTTIESPKMTQAEYEKELQDKLEEEKEKEQREQVKRNIVVETIPNLDEKLDSSEVTGICNGIDAMDGKCKFNKKLIDQIAEEAEKNANKIKADPKVLGSYAVPNSVKDCGKYFDLEEKQQQQNNKKNIVEDSREKSILTWRSTQSSVLPKSTTNSKLTAIDSKMSKLTELVNKIRDLQHAFGDDVFDKVPFVLKLMLGASFRKILWHEAEMLKQYDSLHNEMHTGLLIAVEMLVLGPCSPESDTTDDNVEWFVLDEALLKLPMDKLLMAEEMMFGVNKNPDM